MRQYFCIKTAFEQTIKLAISFSLALAPTIAYAADPTTSQTSADQNQTQYPPLNTLQRRIAALLLSTGQTQSKNFNVAFNYVAKGDKQNAIKYFVNGVSATALAGLMTTNISDIFNPLSQNYDGGVSITTSHIDNAIAQAGSGQAATPPTTPTVTPVDPFGVPSGPVVDFPGIITTPSSVFGVNSSDDQVKILTDLMNTNPTLRTLLWQTAQDRLAQTGGELGVNPPAIDNSQQAGLACDNAWITPLCALGSAFGVTTRDYQGEIAKIKDRSYGRSLDDIANEIILSNAFKNLLVGAASQALRGYNSTSSTINNNWGGGYAQSGVDLSINLATYIYLYGTVATLAALYNVPLSQADVVGLSVILLGLSRVYKYAKKSDGGINNPQNPIGTEPFPEMNFLGRIVSHLKQLGGKKGVIQLVKEDAAKDPMAQQVLEEARAATHGESVLEEKGPKERAKKLAQNDGPIFDPSGPTPTTPPFPSGPGAPAPAPAPIPEPAPTKIPDPTQEAKGGFAAIAADVAIRTLGRMALNGGGTVVAGMLAKSMFRASYRRERLSQEEIFNDVIQSSLAEPFLKLLILSQAPDSLALTVPATQQQSPSPSQPTKSGTTFNPFADVLSLPNNSNVKSGYGGNASDFIIRFARSLHICSKDDLTRLNSKEVLKTKQIVRGDDALGLFNSWDDNEEKDRKRDTFFKFYKTNVIVSQAVAQKKITQEDAENILLIHDCGRVNNFSAFTSLQQEMISFAKFSDSDLKKIRQASVFVRLRMGETIEQLLFLNGRTLFDDSRTKYLKAATAILGIDSVAFGNYFMLYEAQLVKNGFVADPYSPTGFALASGGSTNNPYDPVVPEILRPDEPQALHPISRPANSNSSNGINGIGGFGGVSGGVTGDPFSPGGGIGSGMAFSAVRAAK